MVAGAAYPFHPANAAHNAGFMRTNDRVATPDIQFHVQPWSADSPSQGVHPFSAFTMSVCQLRPESRGSIRLKSADPSVYPAIHPNYLATETDCQTIVDGVRIARRIAAERPLSGKITGEMRPGPEVRDDAALLDWVRNSATTIFHPTGTAAMGPVLDDRLRVKGIRGLRVAGPIAIGMSRVPWSRFLALNFVGAVCWAVLIGGLGYSTGHALAYALQSVDADELWGLALLAVAICITWLIARHSPRGPSGGKGAHTDLTHASAEHDIWSKNEHQ